VPLAAPPEAPPFAAGGGGGGSGGGGGGALAAWRASLVLPVCPICAEDQQPAVALGCGDAGHKLCMACALRHARAEPGEGRIRCPNGCGVYCDARCDCPDCAECRPGRPCEACDNFGVRGELSGRCWACQPEKRPVGGGGGGGGGGE
jgi:hypothetical protein